ncbi:MAG: RNA polymerase sigma factor [Chitinophagaceae bacterium]
MDSKTLISACLKNNRAAQKHLYNTYADVMLGVCYRYTKSLADAEDVLQEGFIKVFSSLQQYKHQGELAGWVRRIMVNSAIDYIKKHSRYRNELAFEQLPMHPVSDENPDISLDTKDLVELIRELPAGYQAVFNLVAIEGFNHIETGQLLGISEQTSRSQYSRARTTLIKQLNNISSSSITKSYAR